MHPWCCGIWATQTRLYRQANRVSFLPGNMLTHLVRLMHSTSQLGSTSSVGRTKLLKNKQRQPFVLPQSRRCRTGYRSERYSEDGRWLSKAKVKRGLRKYARVSLIIEH